jgi:hypothetical protein
MLPPKVKEAKIQIFYKKRKAVSTMTGNWKRVSNYPRNKFDATVCLPILQMA